MQNPPLRKKFKARTAPRSRTLDPNRKTIKVSNTQIGSEVVVMAHQRVYSARESGYLNSIKAVSPFVSRPITGGIEPLRRRSKQMMTTEGKFTSAYSAPKSNRALTAPTSFREESAAEGFQESFIEEEDLHAEVQDKTEFLDFGREPKELGFVELPIEDLLPDVEGGTENVKATGASSDNDSQERASQPPTIPTQADVKPKRRATKCSSSLRRPKTSGDTLRQIEFDLLEYDRKTISSKPSSENTDLTILELDNLIKVASANQKDSRQTKGAVKRFQTQHERHDTSVNASDFRLTQENFAPLEGEFLPVKRPGKATPNNKENDSSSNIPYLLYHDSRISGIFMGWQSRVGDETRRRVGHLSYCNARLSKDFTCSCHVPYGARILGVDITNALRRRHPAKLMRDSDLPSPILSVGASRSTTPPRSRVSSRPPLTGRPKKSIKDKSKMKKKIEALRIEPWNDLEDSNLPQTASNSSFSKESFVDSIKSDDISGKNHPFNLYSILGGERSIVLDEAYSEITAPASIALRLLGVAIDAVVKLQRAFRARIAYKTEIRETAAATNIQRWYRAGKVKSTFVWIQDMLESDGYSGTETINIEEEMIKLENISNKMGSTMTTKENPRKRLKHIRENWDKPVKKVSKCHPDTLAFSSTAKKLYSNYEIVNGVAKRKETYFSAGKSAKGKRPTTKPATPKSRAKTPIKDTQEIKLNTVTAKELIKSGVPIDLSLNWAIGELKKL